MNSERLNEHDANQGAQSKGEFLGMTGNSAWYLLGAAGASIMLTIIVWGMLGLSLIVCLATGLALCGLSLAYVFALKNNRPEHYDSDFVESALVEAGVLTLAFGPRAKRPTNPFRSAGVCDLPEHVVPSLFSRGREPRGAGKGRVPAGEDEIRPVEEAPATAVRRCRTEVVRVVPLAAYERLQSDLTTTEDLLEDALMSREEDGLCD